MTWRGGVFVAAMTSIALSSGVSLAAPCGRADLLDAFPKDGATGVPTDATLSAHYAQGAEYLGETVSFGLDSAAVSVQAQFDETESLVSVKPGGALQANTKYEVDWPALRGLNSAAVGSAFNVHFTTGSGPDAESPVFDGVTSIEFDVSHERDECTNSVADRYQFRLGLSDATDDSGADALALLVFQTSGPNIPEGSPEPVLLTPFPASKSVTLNRAVSDAVGHICFAAIVKDLTGKISSSGDREVCTQTAAPPVFFGCALAPARSPTSHGAILWALAAVFAGIRRRAAVASHAR